MTEDILQKVGLTTDQAKIMTLLYGGGTMKATDIAVKSGIVRGVVYIRLEELLELALIEKIEIAGQAGRFRAAHPARLEELIKEKVEEAKKNQASLLGALPDIVSACNLNHNKPGVRFFEGAKGFGESLEDTLASKTEILTFADRRTFDDEIKKINTAYINKRNRLGIKKRMITPLANRESIEKESGKNTSIRYFKGDDFPFFSTGIQIYDNKVLFLTTRPDNKFAVIVEDQGIYEAQKTLFEYLWKHGTQE